MKLFIFALLFSLTVIAQTPAPGTVAIKGGTDGTKIGNVGDALKVSMAAAPATTVNQGTAGIASWLVSVTNIPHMIVDSVATPVAVTGTFWQATQPVSIAGTVAVSGPLTDSQLRATPVPISGTVAVSNFPATQNVNVTNASIAVTGTFWQATQPVSGPLTNAQLRASDVDVNITNSSIPVTGTFFQATQPVSIASPVAVTGPLTDTQLRATPVPISGTVTVGANQSVNLNQIIGAAPSSTNYLPERLTDGTSYYDSRQIRALTSGGDSVTAVGSGNFTVVQPTGSSLHTTVDSGSITVSGTVAATQSGTWTNTVTQATGTNLHTTVDNFPATQPVSGTVTANAGTNLNTSALNLETTQSAFKSANHTDLLSVVSTLGSPFQAGGSIGNSTFGASQSGTWNITNISGTVSLPTGASTAANQTTANSSLSSIDSKTPALGQALAAASVPVVLTAAQLSTLTPLSTVAVTQSTSPWVTSASQSGTWNINNISGTVSLPTGAATAANQTTVIANQTNGTQLIKVTQLPLDTAPATQNITIQDTGSTTTAVANGQNFITGSPTANSTASFAVASSDSFEVQVTGLWTGTLQLEVSIDGGTTWATRGVKQTGSAYIASSFTSNFAGGANIAGITNFRVRAITAMTGTATVRTLFSNNAGSVIVTNPQMLRDATTQSIFNTIKAASTPAATTDTALVVALSPNSSTPSPTGSAAGQLVRNDYSSVNVTTAAYTQLIASTTNVTNHIFIFDSSGQTLFLAVGAAASEVNKYYIVPGGNGLIDLNIPAGSRISVKAVSANATAGELDLTLLQ